MAWYPKALRKNIPPSSSDPRITPRLAILHVAVVEGPSLYDYFNGRSGGVESHFYIRYSGVVEQYRDTAYQADANMQANDFAVSIETEGLAAGTWTAAQLVAIKELLLWLHATHNIPLSVPKTWNGSGVGYHILFMQEWAGGPRSCPGPDRIKQFNNILVPWMAQGGDDVVTDEDVQRIAKASASYLLSSGTSLFTIAGDNPERLVDGLARGVRNVEWLTGRVKALEAALEAMATSLPEEAAAAVVAALSKTYDASVVLTEKDSA